MPRGNLLRRCTEEVRRTLGAPCPFVFCDLRGKAAESDLLLPCSRMERGNLIRHLCLFHSFFDEANGIEAVGPVTAAAMTYARDHSGSLERRRSALFC